MTLGRVELTPGAVLTAGLLYYLDESGVLPWLLLAALCHELGHWWAVEALGGRVVRLRLTAVGAELVLSRARPLPPGRTALAALAGPGANLLLALGSAALARRGWGEGLYLFAGLDLGLAVFNLLPAERLDGGRALRGALTLLGREALGEHLAEVGTAAVALLLLSAGAALLWESGGRGSTLLIAGLWIAAGRRGARAPSKARKKRKKCLHWRERRGKILQSQ